MASSLLAVGLFAVLAFAPAAFAATGDVSHSIYNAPGAPWPNPPPPVPPAGTLAPPGRIYSVGGPNTPDVTLEVDLCGAIAGATCSVNPSTFSWTTGTCPIGSASFTASTAVPGRSNAIGCSVALANVQDAGICAGGFVQYGPTVISKPCSANSVNPSGADAWAVSCVSGDVTYTVAIPPTLGTYVFDAHDWALTLDATQPSHTAALAEYAGASGSQGEYDNQVNGIGPC